MALEVRRVRPEEYEEAGRVTALAYGEFARPESSGWQYYLKELADVAGRAERTAVLVAVEDGRIWGTATLELCDRVDPDSRPLAPTEAHLRMLGVHPDARGRHIGKRLVEACVAQAKRAGKTILTLNTTLQMRVAQRMYESMGFRRGPNQVFDDGFTLLSYDLPL